MNFHNINLAQTLVLALFWYVGIHPARAAVSENTNTVVAEVLSNMRKKMREEHEAYQRKMSRLMDPYSNAALPSATDVVHQPGHSEGRKKPELMGAIDSYRAKICADMKDEHGLKFASSDACDTFMAKACNPGRDGKMDGDRNEIHTGKGYCSKYFNDNEEAEKGGKQAHDSSANGESNAAKKPRYETRGRDEGGAAANKVGGGRSGSGDASDLRKVHNFDDTQTVAGRQADSRIKLTASAPAPGPAPGQAPGGAYPEDEQYYWKSGGVDPDRFHMNEKLKLPTQGYWGKLVEHTDGETSVGDWQQEGGMMAAHKICEEHPESAWCRKLEDSNEARHSHDHPKSSAMSIAGYGGILAYMTVSALC